MDTGKIIARIRADNGLTMVELARRAEISVSYLNDIEKGRSKPTLETLSSIAHALNQSVGYLIGERTSVISIPILGTIRAGIPLLADDQDTLGEVEVPVDLKADFALNVTGDSMSWVGIYAGDLAILRQLDVPSHGMIVAAGIEDYTFATTLKFYVEQNGIKLLRAANPEYKDIPITDEHRIIGHVVSIRKEVPSLQDYRRSLLPREVRDKEWQDTIEACTGLKLSGKRVWDIIESFTLLARGK